MKPNYFEQANAELTKPKEMKGECDSLFVRRTNNGQCISLWKATLWQRIVFLFHGNLWLSVLSGETQPPVWLELKKNVFDNPEDKKFKISVPQPNRKRRKEFERQNQHILNPKVKTIKKAKENPKNNIIKICDDGCLEKPFTKTIGNEKNTYCCKNGFKKVLEGFERRK